MVNVLRLKVSSNIIPSCAKFLVPLPFFPLRVLFFYIFDRHAIPAFICTSFTPPPPTA